MSFPRPAAAPRRGLRSRILRAAATTLPATALLAVAAGSASAAAAKIYVGTPGGDRIVGKSPKGNVLWGGGGYDTLIGGKGDDFIYGVRGANKISGRGGNDYIEGGAGNDKINTGPGNNTVFGSSGHDDIRAGDGNNYIDAGGATDKVVAGHGNNVVHTGTGGITLTLGNGNNTVYYASGIARITAGSGANTFYLAGTAAVRSLKCGGNPNTVVYVNSATLTQYSLQIFKRDKARGCPTILTYDGSRRTISRMAPGMWEPFRLIGTDRRDKLFGNHGGGYIEGKGGDDEIWADHFEETGGAEARSKTTTIDAGTGNNRIFGGRGTNIITAGDGNHFVRAGAHVNEITLGAGIHLVRLQGARSTNTVVLRGRAAEPSYVESLANGKRPIIRCENGARAVIVYGNTKPKTNCGRTHKVRSKRGKQAQVLHTPGVPASDPILEDPIAPGENGIGVARPAAAAG